MKITEIQFEYSIIVFFLVFFFLESSGWLDTTSLCLSTGINWMYQITFECWCWLWSKEWGMKQTTNKTKNQKKWNKNKKKTKISKMWEFLCQNKHNFFCTQEQMQENSHSFLFLWSLDAIWVSSVLFCWVKSCLGTEISAQMKKQQKCVVWLVSKQKRMVFHPMTKCKRKNPLCCLFFGSFVVMFEFLSFLLIGWKAFLEQNYFHTCLKNTSKNKNAKTCQFSKNCWKRKVLAHCEKQQFLLWHKKRKKNVFSQFNCCCGKQDKHVCVCVLSNVMTVSTKHKYFQVDSRADWKILCQTYELFWCDFCICNKHQSKIEKKDQNFVFL